jgi:hypothetical protein
MFQAKPVEEIKTHILCSLTFFWVENHAIYAIMWKHIVEWGRPRTAIWRMRFACWILKARNTYSDYVILAVFPLQHRLQERASLLWYTYIECLVELWVSPNVGCEGKRMQTIQKNAAVCTYQNTGPHIPKAVIRKRNIFRSKFCIRNIFKVVNLERN